jgi:hypothetical protein
MTWDMPWEETKHALSPSSVIFGVKTWALAANRQRIRTGDRRYAQTVPVPVVFQWVIISSFVLGGAPENCYHSLGRLWCSFPLGQFFHPSLNPEFLSSDRWSILNSTYCSLGVVFIPCQIRCYQFCPSWNPRWLQSDYKENVLEQRLL